MLRVYLNSRFDISKIKYHQKELLLMHIEDNFEEFEKVRTIDSLLIWIKLNNITTNFKVVHENFLKFVDDVASEASKKWSSLKRRKFSTEEEKIKELAEIVKAYRLEVLQAMTSAIFDDLWYLRAETELLIAIFHFGFISDFVIRDFKWEEKILAGVKPIVLRLKTPSKTNFKGYSLNKEIRKMFRPLLAGFDETSSLISTIKTPNSLTKLERDMIKKHETSKVSDQEVAQFKAKYGKENMQKKLNSTYKVLFKLREELTKLTQACSPR